MLKTGYIAIIVCIMAAFCVSAASAGIAVSPMQQWLVIKPDQQNYFTVTVSNVKRNENDSPQKVNVSLVDYDVSVFGDIKFGKDLTHPRSAVKFANLEDGNYVINPGEQKEIKINVNTPPNADGDYWGAVLVKLVNDKKIEKGGVNVGLQTASGFFIHVPRKNYVPTVKVTDANIQMPVFNNHVINASVLDSNTPKTSPCFEINATLANEGVVTVIPEGTAFLYSKSNRRVASIPMHTNRRDIHPGHTRKYSGILSQPLPAGEYSSKIIFDSKPEIKLPNIYESGRKAISGLKFVVSPEAAAEFAKAAKSIKTKTISIEPNTIEIKATPGRFTSDSVLVSNKAFGTLVIDSSIGDSQVKDWIELAYSKFTFAPNMKRNITLKVRVPKDTQVGKYQATLLLNTEHAGLVGEQNKKEYKVPVIINVIK